MDKREAGLILCKYLAEEKVHIVSNETVQRSLYEKALFFEPLEEMVRTTSYETLKHENIHNLIETAENNLIKISKESGTNYLFTELHLTTHGSGGFSIVHIEAYPVAIIGEREKEWLQKRFYKDTNDGIEYALHLLGIPSYNSIYSKYLNEPESIVEFICKQFRQQDGTKKGNERAEAAEFILTLPLEEQNHNSNKKLLKSSLVADEFLLGYFMALYRERPEQFIDYAGCFTEESEPLDQLINYINKLDENQINPRINSWLYNQGYTDVKVSHLYLYQNNPKSFKNYFKMADPDTRSIIISDIFNLKEKNANPELDKWISEEELLLVEKICSRKIAGEPGK